MDEKGRPVGYRNLEALADRVSSVMLRRRKEDVESQLPARTTKTFFVPMTEAQLDVYDGYEHLAQRLAAIAAKRPLTPEEFKALQGNLACMRMVCDTPYILDGRTHACPKMEEIEGLLPDLLDDPGRKIIIFSEWVRMLELVRDYAVEAGIEFAWHTGSVPQPRRRAEIQRFRKGPRMSAIHLLRVRRCGTEPSGGRYGHQHGPAVESRPVGAAHRPAPGASTRPAPSTSSTWVSEHTIEHRMLGLLDAKRALAEGVLDRKGDLTDIRMPNSRAAFMERLQAVLGAGPEEGETGETAPGAQPPVTAHDHLRDALVAGHGAALQRILATRRHGRRAGRAQPSTPFSGGGRTPPQRIDGIERQGHRP